MVGSSLKHTGIKVEVRTPVQMVSSVIGVFATVVLLAAIVWAIIGVILMWTDAEFWVYLALPIPAVLAWFSLLYATVYFLDKKNLYPPTDTVILKDDRLVFVKRGSVYFSNIAAYGMDNALMIKRRKAGTLLVGHYRFNRGNYNFFRHEFERKLKTWCALNQRGNPPVRKYFYGTFKARAIGWSGLSLITGVVIMAFVLEIGTGAAIAVVASGGGVPIFLKMALGQRPAESD